MITDDALIRACVDEAAGELAVAVLQAAEVEAQVDVHGRMPRHWLLAGDGHAVLLDTRSLPRISRRPWRPGSPVPFADLVRRLQRLAGPAGRTA